MHGLSPAALREALKPTPTRLLAGILVTIAASLLWGVSATWTAVNRTSAANDTVAITGPLSFYAQQIYQSLSDADATEAAAFLAATESPAARARFHADIAQAGTYLQAVAAAGSDPTANTDLTTLNTGLPEYSVLLGEAQADNQSGLPVGASYLQEASYLMRSRLLPAAGDLYQQESTRLAGSYGRATGFPVAAVVVAVVCGLLLLRVQQRLARRTHRVLNRGLVLASLIWVLSVAWLLGSWLVARSSLSAAYDHGAAPAKALVQAEIVVLRAHADESLTLINRSGDDASEADFKQAERQLGPGPGTLLSEARTAGTGSPGHDQAVAAGNAATAWYAVHGKVRALDDSGDYPEAVQWAVGSGANDSASAFQAVEADLTAGIGADQHAFASSASVGDHALGGLTAEMIAVALLMAAACTRGLGRRLAEYR